MNKFDACTFDLFNEGYSVLLPIGYIAANWNRHARQHPVHVLLLAYQVRYMLVAMSNVSSTPQICISFKTNLGQLLDLCLAYAAVMIIFQTLSAGKSG